jgi:1-acyl-sn-glycerol-3-phosphate acyltransferase
MIDSSVLRAARRASRGMFHALAELGGARHAPPRDARDAAHRLAGAVGAVARAHDLDVSVRGDIPRHAALVVANHVGYLDPLAILPVCPAAPLAKSEVASWPIVGAIAGSLGVVFVRRADVHGRARALRRIHALLAGGVSVLNFPEGTTTSGDRVQPFARGGFGIAQRLGVPVVPVAIRYRDAALAWTDNAAFLPHYARATACRRLAIDLAFGAAMPPRAGEPAEDMAARARNAIVKLLRSLHDATGRVHVSPSRSDAVLPPARVA